MKTREVDGAHPAYSANAWAARQAVKVYSQGLLAETCSMDAQRQEVATMISGKLYLTAVGLLRGDPISALMDRMNVASSAGTLMKKGLFQVEMNGTDHRARLLATTADATAGYAGAVGPKTTPLLAAPYVPTDDDMLYVGSLFVGTTGPVLYAKLSAGVSSNAPKDGLTGLVKGFGYVAPAQADFPAVGAQVPGALVADSTVLTFYTGLY